jgi:hypothetical protein
MTWDDWTAPMIMSFKSGFFFLSFAEDVAFLLVAASVAFLMPKVDQHPTSTVHNEGRMMVSCKQTVFC